MPLSLRDIFIIGEAFDEHVQIDRACAAQAPDMLPKAKEDSTEVRDAKGRVEDFKHQAKEDNNNGIQS